MNALEVEPYSLLSVDSERWETVNNHVKLIKIAKFLPQPEKILPVIRVRYVPRGTRRTGEGEGDRFLRLVRISVLFYLSVSGNVMKQFKQTGLSYLLRSMGEGLPSSSHTQSPYITQGYWRCDAETERFTNPLENVSFEVSNKV